MQKVSAYRCPVCSNKYKFLDAWGKHVTKVHPGTIPPDYTVSRAFYYFQTGKVEGKCVVCKSPTDWNEASQKYERFCKRESCKSSYRKMFKDRMIKKYGKTTLLNDPEQQRKMLAAKKMSGKYKFYNGVEVQYCGSYELDFLVFLNTFLHFSGNDIMGPSPHTYYYEYKNPDDKENEGSKFYIPDFYIPSLNLEIEIKQNTNTHPSLAKIDKVKENTKDALLASIKGINYFKIVERDYTEFLLFLDNLMKSFPEMERDIATEAIEKFESLYSPTTDRWKLSSYGRMELNNTVLAAYNKSSFAKERMVTPKGEMLVDNKKFVGMYSVVSQGGIMWIDHLEIHKDYRGHGLGSQLLTRAIRKYKIQNVKILIEDELLITCFMRQGFVEYLRDVKYLYLKIDNNLFLEA